MGRSLYMLVLLGILAGCLRADPSGPSRDQFGVSASRPDAGAARSGRRSSALATKANAICTTGDQVQPPTVLPAQDNQQIVDQRLRCGHYDRLKFDFLRMDWSNVL